MQETVESLRQLFGIGPPCETCKITPGSETPMGYRLGWNHEQFVNDTYRQYFEEPVKDWAFNSTPTWPDSVPYLFLWAGLGFHQPLIYNWLNSRGDGSGHRRIKPGDHWFMVRNIIPGLDSVSATHDAMEEFFAGSFRSYGQEDENPTTILDEEFFQVYYVLDDGKCEARHPQNKKLS